MGGCCLYRWSHKERQQRGDISCTADFIFCLPGAVTPADGTDSNNNFNTREDSKLQTFR